MRDTMSPKQRFLMALHCNQPDRVPLFDFLFSPNLYQHVIGRRPKAYNAEDAVALTKAIGLDSVQVSTGAADSFQAQYLSPDTHIDEWGVTVKNDPEVSWPTGGTLAHSINNRSDWKNYTMPDPYAPGRMRLVETAVRLGGDELAIIGSVSGPFSHSFWMTGLSTLSLMFYDDPELAHEIIGAVADWSVAIAQQMAEIGVDVILIADDQGSTSAPLVSMPFFREFILPYFARVVTASRKLGLPVMMHNDGKIWNLLDDLVASGINAYHPVERAAGMDLSLVKKKYRGKLCPVGNVNNKTTLVSGTLEEVERETIECLRAAAPGGGYILAADHSLHDGQQVQNILKMIETAKKYGHYPLNLPD